MVAAVASLYVGRLVAWVMGYGWQRFSRGEGEGGRGRPVIQCLSNLCMAANLETAQLSMTLPRRSVLPRDFLSIFFPISGIATRECLGCARPTVTLRWGGCCFVETDDGSG